jgi:hypothetical protein
VIDFILLRFRPSHRISHFTSSSMSVTTTQNAVTYNTLSVLVDYELHHSDTSDPAPAPNSHPAPASQNPPEWPTGHRRVPNYRPINRDLDQSQRCIYNNNGERAFITVMLRGVWLNAVSGVALVPGY